MRWYPAGEGQTPLDPDEAQGLILDITTRGELDEMEQLAIAQTLLWAKPRLRTRSLEPQLVSPSGLCQLHNRIYAQIWRWAGSFRATEKNIGVAPHQIPSELKKACDDFAFWIEEGGWDPRLAAARYHHRLVKIHPFVNGNGRHARVVADLFLAGRAEQPLRWPTDRARYIDALRLADARDFSTLDRLLLGEHAQGPSAR